MERRRLGRTDLMVSALCLGTMTWGRQNTEAEGHEQMDYALDQGIDFFDTAEMYAVPPTADTFGKTEEIIGTWFASRRNRDKVILATKAVGNAPNMTWIRGGNAKLDRENLVQAVDDSLRRLQTDYIDLYQLHWPDRPNNRFGQLGYTHDPEAAMGTPILETLRVLDDLVKAGKIRHIGLSNETPWGVMMFVTLAEAHGLPRVVSVQNPYSLINRSYEIGLAETSIREDCGLLAYAPLAAGYISGKYLDGNVPPGTRKTLDTRKSRYDNPQAEGAIRRYMALAAEHGIDVCQMAIAFALRQPFMTSVILGATKMAQLRTDIGARDLALSDAVMEGIQEIHTGQPNPGP